MSVEHETKSTDLAAVTPQSLDLAGIPAAVADELRRLVAMLRSNPGRAEPGNGIARRLEPSPPSVGRSHPPRLVAIDDRRDGIYAGRGE